MYFATQMAKYLNLYACNYIPGYCILKFVCLQMIYSKRCPWNCSSYTDSYFAFQVHIFILIFDKLYILLINSNYSPVCYRTPKVVLLKCKRYRSFRMFWYEILELIYDKSKTWACGRSGDKFLLSLYRITPRLYVLSTY